MGQVKSFFHDEIEWNAVDPADRKEYASFYNDEVSIEVLERSVDDVEWLYNNSKPHPACDVRIMDMIERLEKMIGISRDGTKP